MQPYLALLVLACLVVASTAIGLVLRRSSGRVRGSADDATPRISPADLGVDAVFGSAATLVQFSTSFCGQCPATRRMLGDLAMADGVAHVEVDVTDDIGLAARFRIRQTPTTLLLDAAGRQVARIGGIPRRAELQLSLAALTATA